MPRADFRYLSVCSGMEAASLAFEPLGWKPLAFAEIDAAPRSLLAHRFPHVPLHGDFTRLRDDAALIAKADLLCGGTPCQGFSLAGLRGSLKDDRSNLCLEFVRLANAIDDLRRNAGDEPCFILWENVPGVFSVNYVASAYQVRRLTPTECERLQGAPDGWTLVPNRGKPMADGPRYKMLGNSWAVPCVRYIAQRIEAVRPQPKGDRTP